VGTVYEADDENEEDETQSVVFLTQNQLNKVLANKEVELKTIDDGKWQTQKPLTKEQIRKIGLVSLESEYLGKSGDYKCFEVTKVD
jgi:ribosomal protein L15E